MNHTLWAGKPVLKTAETWNDYIICRRYGMHTFPMGRGRPSELVLTMDTSVGERLFLAANATDHTRSALQNPSTRTHNIESLNLTFTGKIIT